MARNIEIKARVSDRARLLERIASVSNSRPTILMQRDTFFTVPKGRLKLREFLGSPAELIYYERPDQEGPKLSEYIRTPIPDAESLKQILTRIYGMRAIVNKRRELYMVGRTRIHLDDVEGLGSFIELEVVLSEGEQEAEGHDTASGLIEKLGVQQGDLVDRAYVDLLQFGD